MLSPHLRASHRTCHRLWLTLEPFLIKRSVTVCRRVMDESAKGYQALLGAMAERVRPPRNCTTP